MFRVRTSNELLNKVFESKNEAIRYARGILKSFPENTVYITNRNGIILLSYKR